jgi:excisionase family DNA binding protein
VKRDDLPVVPAGERLALKVPEAAMLLGISPSLAYEWVNAGILPAIRVGNAVRIPRRALEAWIEERTTQGRAG